MAKLLLLHLHLLAILSIASTINATTYMVGDTSGWDISSSLDTWSQDKVFKVGDVLMFMYSSSNSVDEVTKENFDRCNTNNALKKYSNGNTTVTLSTPGDKFFISGNKLYCLGGMKLHVNVAEDKAAAAANTPIGSPQAQEPSATSLPVQPSSKNKNNNPSNIVPTSSGVSSYGSGRNSLVVAFVGLLLWMLQV